MTIFPLAYFPPIPWFSAAMAESSLLLEVSAHYEKQEYTNRMWIKTSNGVLSLVVPIQRTGARSPIRDKKISYDFGWQKQHWKSIQTAYRTSPYFEYYEDKFRPFYERKPEFLIDLNTDILGLCFQILKWNPVIELTQSYQATNFYTQDLRKAFDPSLQTPLPEAKPYTQVFGEFTAGLSIFDLICNEGPHASSKL